MCYWNLRFICRGTLIHQLIKSICSVYYVENSFGIVSEMIINFVMTINIQDVSEISALLQRGNKGRDNKQFSLCILWSKMDLKDTNK